MAKKGFNKDNINAVGSSIKGVVAFLNDDEIPKDQIAMDINNETEGQKNKGAKEQESIGVNVLKKKRSYMLTQECISMLLKMKADSSQYQDADLSVIVEDAIREKYNREINK